MTDGQTYSMSYGYNLAGGQTSMTYPSGRIITSEYDGAGRLAGVRDQSSGVYYAGATSTDVTNRMQYAAHGAVSVMKLGNGLWEHTSFNNRLQPTQIGLGTSSADSSTMGLSYNYGTTNNNGNVQSVSYSGGGLSYTQSFGYDALNRLTTSNENSGSSWSQTNGYDQYGNRWIDYGGGVHNLSFSTSTNRITNTGYSYDAAGNLTNDTLHSYTFDGENKIRGVDAASDAYRYDGDGNRVRKNFTSGEQIRMVYSGGQLIAEYDLSTGSLKKEYVYGAKGLIATIEPSAGTRYATADSLGSPRVITNSSGGVVSRHDLMPFGEELAAGTGGRTTAMGYSVADGLRQRYTQKERDIETGLDYFLARYYSSTQGRFTSPDEFTGGPEEIGVLGSGHPEKQALKYAEVTNPQSLNKYQYCFNNPLRFIDPDGQEPQTGGDLNFERDERDFLSHKISEQEFRSRMNARGVGAAVGAAIVVGVLYGPEAATAILMWASRNPDKVGQIALDLNQASTGSPAPGSPGLSIATETRLTATEVSTGVRLAAQTGTRLAESPFVGEEFVSTAGKTYDAMGGGKAFQNFGNGSKFFDSIVHHVNKSVDYVALDLKGASAKQINAIQKFVGGLTKKQQEKIIYVKE